MVGAKVVAIRPNIVSLADLRTGDATTGGCLRTRSPSPCDVNAVQQPALAGPDLQANCNQA
jgi:hypothetical protein